MEVFWNLLRVRRTRSPQIFPPGLQVWQRKSDPYPKLNIDTVANSSCSELKDDELHLADVNVQSPETPGWFSLRLDVYAPSQVLRTYRCVYHPPLPSVLLEPLQAAGLLRSTNVTSLHRYYKPDRHVFDTFEHTGSAFQAVRRMVDDGLRFPCRQRVGEKKGDLTWAVPTHCRVLQVLRNPRYAGAFVYGRSRGRPQPNGRVNVKRLPLAEWQFVFPESHIGYITWDQYLANQQRLTDNSMAFGKQRSSGPVRVPYFRDIHLGVVQQRQVQNQGRSGRCAVSHPSIFVPPFSKTD